MTTAEKLRRSAWVAFDPSKAKLACNRDGLLRIVCQTVHTPQPWMPMLWVNQGRVTR